jgi:hypothetical protein
MFRLIKLAMYAFVGYSLYQLYQGIVAQQEQGGGAALGSNRRESSTSAAGGRGQNLTGAGRGRTVETLDSDGGSVRHSVGRGVVST